MPGRRSPAPAGARRLLLLLPLLAMAEPRPALDGWWGGDRTNIHFTPAGAELEQDCATAEIAGAVRPDASGSFSAAGRWRPEGGPVAGDRPDPGRPARFTGRMENDRLRLTVAVEGGETQQLLLERGRRVKLIRCL